MMVAMQDVTPRIVERANDKLGESPTTKVLIYTTSQRQEDALRHHLPDKKRVVFSRGKGGDLHPREDRFDLVMDDR